MDNPHVKYRGDTYDPEKADQRIEEATGIPIAEIRAGHNRVFEKFKQDLIKTLNNLRGENARLREENAKLRTQIGNVPKLQDASE